MLAQDVGSDVHGGHAIPIARLTRDQLEVVVFLERLAALLPDTAERVKGADTQSVPLSELRVGDVVLVRPGARVPADGTVVEGAADVDESMITGESKSVPKGTGDKVIAGTVASAGSLRVAVTAIGDQTALSGIMRLVATAQASGSRTKNR
jgi:Cu2+-exporting ATPase